MPDELDQAAVVLDRVLDQLGGWAASTVLMLGLHTGLVDALLDAPDTVTGLADRAGVNEPSTREWLGAMLAAGLVTVDGEVFGAVPGLGVALHPAAYPVNLRAYLRMPLLLPALHDDLLRALREGTGISYRTQHRATGRLTDDLARPVLREHLVRDWIAAVPGLARCLSAGATIVDLGCGTGYATKLLATAFPTATCVGLDDDPAAVDRAATTGATVPNLAYHVGGLDHLAAGPPPDVVLLINVLHDLPDPAGAVARVRGSLRPGGYVVAVESSATGDLPADSGRPRAVLGYLSSLVHCVQVSLAAGGTGPGACWGRDRIIDTLRTGGLSDVDARDLPLGRSVFWGRT